MSSPGDDRTSSDALRSLLSIDQLSAGGIRSLLEMAEACAAGRAPALRPFSIAMLFFQPSLRTRLGFAEAAFRLSGVAHVVSALRETSDASAPESLSDTLRVVSGMTSAVVVRTGEALAPLASRCTVPLVNGGDCDEHPTQALTDLFAMQRLCGPIERLSIGVCGDMTMRAARSLLKALALMQPRHVRVMAPPSRSGDAEALLRPLGERAERAEGGAWAGLDVLCLAGLPERRSSDHLDTVERALYAFTPANADRLPTHARVLSPMPVIDEIDGPMRGDPRIAIYQQSDLGVPVRMAVLSSLIRHVQ